MSKIFIQPGEFMLYANTSGSTITSGTPVLVGTRLGIATVDIADGEYGNLAMTGVHGLPFAAGAAATQGAKAYWDNTAKKISTVATANTLVGWFFQPAADGAATVEVKINEMNA